MYFQECMPPQQISPSAASRSAWSLATLAASLKVLAMRLGVALRVFLPVRDPAGGINADDAVRAHAEIAQFPRDAAGFAHLLDKFLPLLLAAHGRAAAGWRPNRRNDRADDKAFGADFVREPFQIVIAGINAYMRVEQEQVHAVKLHAVHLRFGGEIEHRVEINGWFRAGAAFADEAGPHGVMKFWKSIFTHRLTFRIKRWLANINAAKRRRRQALLGIFRK